MRSDAAAGRWCWSRTPTATGPDRWPARTVAVPGDRTTAYLLFRLWAAGIAPAKIEVVPFHEIMPGVADGRYDAGLVIHEARFTYPRYGLTALVDLGEWWERDTGLPIPLGAILAHRDRVDAAAATEWVRDSVRQAWADPAASEAYVLEHAQEMEPDVVVAAHQPVRQRLHREPRRRGLRGDPVASGSRRRRWVWCRRSHRRASTPLSEVDPGVSARNAVEALVNSRINKV